MKTRPFTVSAFLVSLALLLAPLTGGVPPTAAQSPRAALPGIPPMSVENADPFPTPTGRIAPHSPAFQGYASRLTGTATSTGTTTRVSVASDGTEGNDYSDYPSISADGRYVAFRSKASNLVSADTNDTDDIFVHDRETGKTTCVSVASDGTQGNWGSGHDGVFPPRVAQSISADGRYVAFLSGSNNMVSGDTNNAQDIFVHDSQTGQTTRVSVASDGTEGSHSSYCPSISADGRYVVFESWANNLVSGDTNDKKDIFVHDRQTGQTTLVSVAPSGAGGNDISSDPFISADGRYVVFRSDASNLVSHDGNLEADIFVHDRETGENTLVSVSSDGYQANDSSAFASISADGRYVAFSSTASYLISGDTNGEADVFVHDRETGETTRVSVASDGTQGDNNSRHSSISADGRYVAFESEANNLVSGDTNSYIDVFVHDRQTGQTTLVSVSDDGTQANGSTVYPYPSISADGRYVAFHSWANNLVSGDTNDKKDIFVHDRGASGSYATSGRVSDDAGNPIGDVTVSAGSGGSATTNASGTYTLTGLITGTYTITPTKNGWTFSPASRTLSVPPDATGQDFTAHETSQGFQPGVDGYSFANRGSPASWLVFLNTFGTDQINEHPYLALMYYDRFFRDLGLGGNCYGMASTSLLLYKGMVPYPENGKTTTYSLSDPDQDGDGNWDEPHLVGNFIKKYFLYQTGKQIVDYLNAHISDAPDVTLNLIKDDIDAGLQEGYVLGIHHPSHGGHAITPFDYAEDSDVIHFSVYDNNYHDETRLLHFYPMTNTWTYDMGGYEIWSGNATSPNIHVTPLSMFQERPQMLWLDLAVLILKDEILSITNADGQVLGYDADGTFFSNIPGAKLVRIFAVTPDADTYPSDSYIVPWDTTYEIEAVWNSTSTTTLSVFGSETLIDVSGQADTDSLGYIEISGDLSVVTSTTTANLLTYDTVFHKEAITSTRIFTIANTSLVSGETANFQVGEERDSIVYRNDGQDRCYDLGISQVGEKAGNLMVDDLCIHAGDVHTIRISDTGDPQMPGANQWVLDIDHGGDGTVDETQVLENRRLSIFLPLVLKGYASALPSSVP